MKVTGFVVNGGFESKVSGLRVCRNERFFRGVADPTGWRLVADLPCADSSAREGAEFTPRWCAPDFEVRPGGLYTFLVCDDGWRPLGLLNPEGLAVPEGIGQMTYSEWQVWARTGGAEGGE